MAVSKTKSISEEQPTGLTFLADKVVKLTRDIGTLVKSEQNKEQKYAYVSIDGYYELVAHRAAEMDLSWKTRLIEHKHIGNETSRSGNVSPLFLFVFAFDLYDSVGNEYLDFAILPVAQVLRGPQGTGSALSYADKLFMRTTFKVATKEGDGDEEKPAGNVGKPEVRSALDFGSPPKVEPEAPEAQQVKAGPAPAEEEARPAEQAQSTSEVKAANKVAMPSTQDWENVSKVFQMGIGTQETYKDLLGFWRDNAHVLDEMKKTAPAVYEELVKKFQEAGTARKAKEGIQ